MATIRPMRDKWQAIVRRKGHPTLTKSFSLRKDAEKWARLQEHLLDAGQWVDQTEAKQTALGELLERYSREISVTKRGAEIEAIRLKALCRSKLARYSVAAITGQLLANWRDERMAQVSSSTVSRELQLLGHVFTVAIREWGYGLNSNPVSLIRKPTPNKARDRVLSNDERKSLLAALESCRNPWIKAVVTFALETATRRGEILSLTWDCVDLQRGTARVDGKTGPRTIPLSPTCIALLKALPRSLDGYVFPVTVEALKQAYGRAVARAAIEDFTFHDLRHDALTRLAKKGLSILELRAISGHTSANMLQRYVSIDAGDLAQKLATVG